MSIKCLMNGLEVNYPCSPVCALFGDCVTAFESQKKANVRTNADHIRAMSDEELAAIIMCPLQFDEKADCIEGSCFQCSLKWLQQPAEEDDHD